MTTQSSIRWQGGMVLEELQWMQSLALSKLLLVAAAILHTHRAVEVYFRS